MLWTEIYVPAPLELDEKREMVTRAAVADPAGGWSAAVL
jgi:hypothetical protein